MRLFGCLLFLLALVAMPLRAQDAGVPVNITTWQQDDPSVCAPPAAACVDRTGQNLQEGKLTSQFLKNNLNNFGLVCQVLPTSKYPIDGQIYAQPLIVTGVNIAGGIHTVAYVVTQNDSVYAVDATNCTVLVPPAHLLNSGQVAVDCSKGRQHELPNDSSLDRHTGHPSDQRQQRNWYAVRGRGIAVRYS